MAKSETFTATPAVAEMIRAEIARRSDNSYFEGGATLTELDDGKFEIYGGNRGDREAVLEMVKKFAARTNTGATPRQLAFLGNLISRDPGLATTIGASPDGVHVAENLTKTTASQLIDQLLNN